MFTTIIKGGVLGFSMSVIFIGPALFALIQTSIKNGFRQAAAMALGIAISDAFFVFLAYLGAEQFLSNPKVKIYEGIGGSIILFAFGIFTLLQKHEDEKDEKKGLEMAAKLNQNKKLPLMLAKGFALNLLNPMVLFMWIGVMANVHHVYTQRTEVLEFFAGTLGMILFLDLVKALIANRIRKILTHNLMLLIHYIMGIALIVCGGVLLYNVFSGGTASA